MKLNRKAWLLFLCLMCAVNMIVCFQYYASEQTEKISLGENLVSTTGEINRDNSVISTFSGNGNELAQFEVFLSTFNRKNEGTLVCTITEGDAVVFTDAVNMADIEDNSFHTIDCSGTFLKENVVYTLSLSAETEKESVTAWLDADGNIVANIYTVHKLTITKLLAVNLVYALLNYLLCLMIFLLKHK